jgi:hypothetical protein
MALNFNVGMAVPGASNLMAPSDQVANETEEQRKKRLAALQASQRMTPGLSSLGLGYGSALG